MEREKILLALIAVLAVFAAVNQFAITGAATQQTSTSARIALVPYNDAGYQQLLGYDKSISLGSSELQNYAGLDVELPCCGFKTLSAAGNCGCGHHSALSGLAKMMARNGYSKAQIQSEIDAWKDVFYPSDGSAVGSGSMAC